MRHALRAFRHRRFGIFWSAALISNAGQWLQNLTIPYVLFELTGRELWVGLATFCQFLPVMALGPLGGALADRHDRRRVLLVTQVALALCALALWASWTADLRSPAWILTLTAAGGVASGLMIPSWQAFVPSLVPREDLASAITLNSTQFNAARALGPTVGGVLLATLGAGWAFLLNAVSFIVVIAALVAIGRAGPATAALARSTASVRQGFGEALAYVAARPGIVVGIVVAVLVGALGNPVLQFTVVYAEDVYDVGPVAFGVLSASLGVGAILATPLVSGMLGDIPRGSVVRVALPLYGLAVAAFGASTTLAMGVATLMAAGAGFLAVISVTNTAVQAIVTDRLRGRVMAVRIMSFTAAYPIGGLIQGVAADALSPRPVVTTAGLLLTAAGLVLATRPGLLERLDDPSDDGP